MQTFAPEGRNIVEGFHALDDLRLNKQGVETYQIMRTLLGLSSGWQAHPATVMWSNHIGALAKYGEISRLIWIDRGRNDNILPYFTVVRKVYEQGGGRIRMPKFLDDIAESHRSNLIRKNPDHYGKIWPGTPDNIPYLWPGA